MRVGLPENAAGWVALAAAVAMALAGARLVRGPDAGRASGLRGDVRFVALAALAAAGLSGIYVRLYLRGGPRIIDATSYWLEARAMAAGLSAWPAPEPAASTLGRFLVARDAGDGVLAAVIFPPGYPALLALGFVLGAPLAVGPVLAAALVAVTYGLASWLAKSLEATLGATVGGATATRTIPRVAALLSVVCAALRYHTADTMSHGLAALCFGGGLLAWLHALDALGALGALGFDESVRAIRRRACGLAALAGALGGWLAATRPATALALAVAMGLAMGFAARAARASDSGEGRASGAGERRDASAVSMGRLVALIACAAGAALPGLALLAAHQHAATGELFASSQLRYYATSDGPAGCFRYGFGAGIGCLGEHGDFVRANLPGGFDAIAAVKTTLRRLRMHLVDAGNAEPFTALVAIGLAVAWRARRTRIAAAAVALVVAAYAPFYFDGSYPGGGARMYADALPVEHALAAAGVAWLATRWRAAPDRLGAGAVALALAGFGVRAGLDHAALRDREGGRPMFEAPLLAAAGPDALVFVDTDHGFNLGFDPAARGGGPRIARWRGDALDWMTWTASGRPPAFHYQFDWGTKDVAGPASARLVPIDPDSFGADRIEGESLWPPRWQRGAWAWPEHVADACASSGRVLAVRADDRGAPNEAERGVGLRLPARWLRGATLSIHPWVAPGARGAIRLVADGRTERTWRVARDRDAAAPACAPLEAHRVPDAARALEIVLAPEPSATGATIADAVLALDHIALRGTEPSATGATIAEAVLALDPIALRGTADPESR